MHKIYFIFNKKIKYIWNTDSITNIIEYILRVISLLPEFSWQIYMVRFYIVFSFVLFFPRSTEEPPVVLDEDLSLDLISTNFLVIVVNKSSIPVLIIRKKEKRNLGRVLHWFQKKLHQFLL